jgi:uncharacterized protein
MKLGRTIVSLALVALPAAAQHAEPPPPILDVHLHVSPTNAFGSRAPSFCPEETGKLAHAFDAKLNSENTQNAECANRLSAADTEENLRGKTLAILEEYNITAVAMLPRETAKQWQSAEPRHIIPGLFFSADQKFDRNKMDDERAQGKFAVLGEEVTGHEGFSPSDPDWDRYLAMAEEQDIPLGIQMGPEPPGAKFSFGEANYREEFGDPLVLKEALARHPRLRMYVMHAGWPHCEGMIALMAAHPQVYVDVSLIDWYLPRQEFHKYLRRLVEAGFGKRIMFGSDELIWPDALQRAIGGITSADFLSAKQKRDILYNNAAKFLRFDPRRRIVR